MCFHLNARRHRVTPAWMGWDPHLAPLLTCLVQGIERIKVLSPICLGHFLSLSKMKGESPYLAGYTGKMDVQKVATIAPCGEGPLWMISPGQLVSLRGRFGLLSVAPATDTHNRPTSSADWICQGLLNNDTKGLTLTGHVSFLPSFNLHLINNRWFWVCLHCLCWDSLCRGSHASWLCCYRGQ